MRTALLNWIVTGGFILSCPWLATAQQPATVEPGAKIRVTLDPAETRVVGTYVRRLGDSLEMEFQGTGSMKTRIVALDRITRLEVAYPYPQPAGRSALLGGAIGGAAGVLAGLTDEMSGESVGFYSAFGAGTGALVGFVGHGPVVGGAVGAVAGAGFGAAAPASCCVPLGWTRGEAVVLWAAVGAGGGVLIGEAEKLLRAQRWIPGTVAHGRPVIAAGGAGVHLGWTMPLGR